MIICSYRRSNGCEAIVEVMDGIAEEKSVRRPGDDGAQYYCISQAFR